MSFAQYLAAAPADEFFWWCAVPAGGALVGLVAGFTFLLRTRLIENMPTSRIRSAAQGYVELEGRARLMDGPPIFSPLTMARCIWWRYRVEQREEHYTNGRRHTSWTTVDRDVSDNSFFLEDDTGRCIVDPVGADVVAVRRRRWYGNTRRPTVGAAAGGGLLRALTCKYRYTEELLLSGDALYALGGFRTQASEPDSFDEKADLTALLSKWKHDRKMMALLDVNKDGAVDAREWEAARRVALKEVRHHHVQRAADTADLHILGRPKDRRPFVLSGVPQAVLVRRWRLRSGLCSAAALAGGTFALWTLQARGLL